MQIIPIILCGGIGKRLWPLSNRKYPKQFIAMNGKYSGLQQTIMRVNNSHKFAPPIIISNIEYDKILKEQLRNYKVHHILLESENKNTAVSVALATLHLLTLIEDSNTQILILPTDHYIADQNKFIINILNASNYLSDHLDGIHVFGIKPSKVETNYGYLKKGCRLSELFFEVESFTEKPNVKEAHDCYNNKEYFWNSGIYLTTLAVINSHFLKYTQSMYSNVQQALNKGKHENNTYFVNSEIFNALPNVSLDVAIMEKSDKIIMSSINDVGWKDLGNWEALINSDIVNSNNIYSLNSENIFAYSEDKTITLVGVKDMIILNMGNNIFIIHKNNIEDFIYQHQIGNVIFKN